MEIALKQCMERRVHEQHQQISHCVEKNMKTSVGGAQNSEAKLQQDNESLTCADFCAVQPDVEMLSC